MLVSGGGVLLSLLDKVFFLILKSCGMSPFCGDALQEEYIGDALSRKFKCEWAVGTVIGRWVMGGPRSGNENILPVDEDIWRARGDVWSILAAWLKVDWGEGDVGKERLVGEGDNEYSEEGDTDDPGVRRPFDVVVGTRRDGDDAFRLVGEDDSVRFSEEGGKGLGEDTAGDRPNGDGMVSPFL